MQQTSVPAPDISIFSPLGGGGTSAHGGITPFLSIHNSLTPGLDELSGIERRMRIRAMRATYPAVDGLVRVSAGVARDLAGYLVVPPEKLPVIYNPVLTSHQLGILPAEPRHPWLAPGQPPFERAVADYRVAASAHTYLDALGLSCPISVGVTAAVPDHD